MALRPWIRGTALLLVSSLLIGAGLVNAGDWTQFRGADTSSVAIDAKPPTAWSDTDKVAWKVDLPGRGLSGPIIVKGKVYLTASTGPNQDRLHLFCFDDATGKKLWERQFWATGRTMCHEKMCNATPTPASDGERIFAFFSSNDLICTDLDGNLQWFRGLTYDYANASNSLGMSSSPIVIGKTLVVQVENDSESFAAGLDVETGKNRWKIDRPVLANWTSPSLAKDGDKPVALLLSGEGLDAVEPDTGKIVWSFKDGGSSIPSSTAAGKLVLAPSKGGLTALQVDSGTTSLKPAWSTSKLAPSTPSPVVVGDKVFTVNRAGVLTCGNLADGETKWQLRLKGPFSGTPVVANGHLYLFSEGGLGQVVKIGDEAGELVSSHDFQETILCTPAIAGNGLYVRSDKHLWKIAE